MSEREGSGQYYSEQLADIYCGDALQILKSLPSESVQMCMTSPPYWGLRNYAGGSDIVWGGDEGCEHVWEGSEYHEHREEIQSSKTRTTERFYGEPSRKFNGDHQKHYSNIFCVKCHAWKGQLGLEPTPELFVEHLTMVFHEVKRVLKREGSFYLNLGDTYVSGKGSCFNPGGGNKSWQSWIDKKVNYPAGRDAPNRMYQGIPPKCMACIPERVMFAMLEDGWILRNKIIWHKPNSMPSSVKDRFTTTWEYLYFFTKARRYYFDLDAVREPHKTQSLERYVSALKRGDGGQGKLEEGIGAIQHREGMDGICAVPRDVADMFGHGPNPQSFNLRVRDVKRGKGGTNALSGELKASQEEIEEYEYPEEHHGSSHDLRDGFDNLTKHDQAVGRDGNVSYTDPLHTRDYSPKGKNPGDYWGLTTQPYKGIHFAVYPEKLCVRPIKASSRVGDVVLDPFSGSGTTGVVAKRLGRKTILIDCIEKYCKIARDRITKVEYQPELRAEETVWLK
jgi:DNA modification methylase